MQQNDVMEEITEVSGGQDGKFRISWCQNLYCNYSDFISFLKKIYHILHEYKEKLKNIIKKTIQPINHISQITS